MREEHYITLQVEGLPEDDGHVRLPHFIERLQALQASVNAVHKTITGRNNTDLYYRIVAASHDSPLKMVIEPVDRDEGVGADSVIRAHDRFFDEVNRLTQGQEPSKDMANEAVESIANFISYDRSRFSVVKVMNQKSDIILSDLARETIKTYLKAEVWSMGSLIGRLDALNFHGVKKKKFYIYPMSGLAKIECTFSSDPEIKEKVKEAIECRVRVFGKKHYRKNQHFPHSIHIETIEKIERREVKHISKLRGTLKSDKPAVETISKLRNGW